MDIKASETIVIQLGSFHLRIGFANQQTPHMIPNVIAYRVSSLQQVNHLPPCDAETLFKAYSIVQNYLNSEGYLSDQTHKIILPKKKARREGPDEEDVDDSEIEIEAIPTPTDTENRPAYLVGHEAYNLIPGEPYSLHWPILRGHFNITDSETQWTVMNDIEKIIEYTMVKTLRVPREMFQQLSVVLIIPDAFYKDQVKSLLDILLRQLGFRAAFLQQESVAAVFGTGVPNACVVDIGARHINVVCVDEGIIMPKTHVRQLYAGQDIDIFLMRILIRPDRASLEDLRMVEALKKEASRLIQQDLNLTYVVKGRENVVRANSKNPILIVSAHSLFHTNLLKISTGPAKLPYHLHNNFAYDTDDYLTDLVESTLETLPQPTIGEVMSLDQMIIRSISAIESSDTRKKMANCILLCGGGAMFPDLVELLEARLINGFPEDSSITRVEVRTSITHSDSSGNKELVTPNHLMWVGGTVIPLLDCAKELWITRSRWLGEWLPTEAKEELMASLGSFESQSQLAEMCKKWRKDRPLEGGVRHIKEKATFIW